MLSGGLRPLELEKGEGASGWCRGPNGVTLNSNDWLPGGPHCIFPSRTSPVESGSHHLLKITENSPDLWETAN